MISATRLLILSTLLALSAAATGQQAIDTSKWLCELCAFEDGLSGSLDLGAENVSDSSSKFGEYNGLGEEGGYVLADGSARYRGADAAYWNVDASNLGLDTRALAAEGGQQGKYKLFLNYDESPHFVSDSAQTPFLGIGGASLTLPGGFPAATTALMPLASTLQPADLETERQEVGVGASFTPARGWVYAVNFRHETRDGSKGTSGAFSFNATQLVAPVDYVTDQMDASASYASARLQAKVAYYGSQFRNGDGSLTWQNPFTPFFGGVDGQLALPPDNEFHQIRASAGYQFTDRTRATANIAFSRMTQDQTFLAPTLNATLAVPALPQASLDGRADLLNANLELNSAVTDRLRLKAEYTHNDRDNRTPQAAYDWVTTDMFVGPPRTRTNLPYGFTQDRFKLRADYRASASIRTSVGFDHDSNERTFQEVDTTRENTIWGKVASRFPCNVDVTLMLAHGDRSNSGYEAVAAVIPPENPLLRRYNMADRTRDSAELRADIAATQRVSIGLEADASDDDYSDSTIGLTSGNEFSLGGDITFTISEQTDLRFFANRQVIKSEQAGSQAYSTPDWRGDNEDTIDLAGIGVKHLAIKDRLEVGADYTATRSSSEISVKAPAGNSEFPDFSTSLDSLKLYASYRMKENMSLRAAYWYEDYDSKNWMLDGVAPDTIRNVLTFGELSPRYRVHVIALSVKYEF